MATFSYDFNPESLTVSTGNYTVPADKYVQVNATSGPTALVVDGTTVLEAVDGLISDTVDVDLENQSIGALLTHYTNNNSFPVLANMAVQVQFGGVRPFIDTGSAEIFIASSVAVGTDVLVTNILVPPGGTLKTDIEVDNSDLEVSITAVNAQYSPVTINFFAPTGTTINGARKIISVYAE